MTQQAVVSKSTRAPLNGLPGAAPAEKAVQIWALDARAAFSPSGIMYSMQHLADGEVRPCEARDFEGAVCINAELGDLQPDGG